MIITSTIALIFITLADLPIQECAIMEATLKIESNNIHMTSILERFKKFIAHSHLNMGDQNENSTSVDKFVQTNDSFKANYDFAQNLLTVDSSYSLLLNGTETKISDVKIIINFRFKQDSDERIILQDLHGDTVPWIGLENKSNNKEPEEATRKQDATNNDQTILGQLLSPVVNAVEPIIVTLIHIVINGVLAHALTSAFDHIYSGRVT